MTDATAEEFTYISQRFSELLLTLGEEGFVEGCLHSIAIFQGVTTFEAFRQWDPRIVELSPPHELPVRCKPWKDHPSIEVVAPTANTCGVMLLNAIHEMVFKEHPVFIDLKTELPCYLAKHRAKLKRRLLAVGKLANYAEWLTLSAKMDLERFLIEGKQPKSRRSTRRCESRDEQFVAWESEGLDGYAIAAKWNSLHPSDNVSNEAVKKAIQRVRDK